METGFCRRSDRPEPGPCLDRRSALTAVGAAALAAVPFGKAGSAVAAAPPPAPGHAAGRTVTATVADYAAATSLDTIPAAVRERARKVIFDEIACSYFGRRSDGGALAAQYVKRLGGAPEARIYGTAERAPAHYAALANGTAGHGEEVDGTHVIGGHPGASIVHAATGMAERQRSSGAELLNAVVLGYDVGVRLVEACGGMFRVRERDRLFSDFFYALGCTAAASRLLRLDPVRHCHALALATFQANALYALFAERRHISKSFCNGQFAFAGISSALMAQTGLEGNEDIIGAREGLLDAWGEEPHKGAVTRGLGSQFKIMGANFKFFNAGQPIHTPVEASMALVRQHRIPLDSIQSILIGMPARALKVVDNPEMHNISVQAMVAANLARGGLKIGDRPFPAILDDPVYRRLRGLVVAQVDPELQRQFPDGRGARVTITTRDGARHSLRIDNPRGHSLRGEPSWDELAAKWTGSLPGCDVARALATARRVDQLSDSRELFAAFAGVMA